MVINPHTWPVRSKIGKNPMTSKASHPKPGSLGQPTSPPKPTLGVVEERVRSPQAWFRKIPASSTRVGVRDQRRSCSVAGSGNRDRKNTISVGAALSVLEYVVERGEEIEPPLDACVVIDKCSDALECAVIRKAEIHCTPQVVSSRSMALNNATIFPSPAGCSASRKCSRWVRLSHLVVPVQAQLQNVDECVAIRVERAGAVGYSIPVGEDHIWRKGDFGDNLKYDDHHSRRNSNSAPFWRRATIGQIRSGKSRRICLR